MEFSDHTKFGRPTHDSHFGTGKKVQSSSAVDNQITKKPTEARPPPNIDPRLPIQSQPAKSVPTNTDLDTAHLLYLNAIIPEHLAPYLESIVDVLRRVLDTDRTAKMKESEIKTQIHGYIKEYSRVNNPNIDESEIWKLTDAVFHELIGLGPLEILLECDDIHDIMVNGPASIYVEKDGQLWKTDLAFSGDRHLLSVCQKLAQRAGQTVSELSPVCDGRLADGSRLNIVLPPASLNGILLTIRKPRRERMTLENLVHIGTLAKEAADFLRIAVICRANILISGTTGGGKTTLLNSLLPFIATEDRIVACEEISELQFPQPHAVRLETVSPAAGRQGLTMRDLVKNCVLMRPDRIVIGEVSGPEAFDLLQAMNSGHRGVMAAIQAGSPRDALTSFENLTAMANANIPAGWIRGQIASAYGVIVQMEAVDGVHRVSQISELSGMEKDILLLQDIFSSGHDGGASVASPTGISPKLMDKARRCGLADELMKIVAKS